MLRTWAAAVLAFAMLASPSQAHADDALAREYFRHGVDLYDKKQYALALESFRSAYAEKPSPGIKQNIALSLKGLGRNVEAATAFDEALDEGADTLKPATRAAMEQELTELSKIVATVRLKIISAADKQPIENVVVTVDKTDRSPGLTLTGAALRRPVRLEPGIHVFAAQAPDLASPPEKKLSILAGSPVDATFELGAAAGVLTIKPSVAEALLNIDGKVVGRGVWSGKLSAGTHRVTATAPGFQATTADVVVSSGASVEYDLTLLLPGGPPPPYDRPPVKKPPPALKPRYLVPMLAYDGQSVRLSPFLGERAGGTKRSFTGGTFGVRVGFRLSRVLALELYGDVGQLKESYALTAQAAESSTKIVHWQLTPMLRFATSGSFRFTVASGFGVHGLSLAADLVTGTGTAAMSKTIKGTGTSASWLVDLGMQLDIGSVLFLEAVAFFDMHGVGSTRDEVTNQRLMLSSPGTRAGIRAGLGIQF